mmetsp:Transcript_4868/g.10580  ORF Transcript_4868/g.10580 Transcript_4868/m.10580 type:complete len:233 (+) Transcript_4868:2178-2876(+)
MALGVVEVGGEHVPVLEADLEDLHVLDVRNGHEQPHRTLQQGRVCLRGLLRDWQVLPEEASEEERQVADEGLVVGGALGVGAGHVGVWRHHRRRLAPHAHAQRRRHLCEEHFKARVVRGTDFARERLVDGPNVERANLGQARKHVVPKSRQRQEVVHESLDERRLENVAERDPVEKLEQRLERADEQRLLRRMAQDVLAKLEDEREVGVERLLQLLCLCAGHLVARKVEHLF